MKNLKQALALVVVLAMVLSSLSFVFAADATTAALTDAKVCETIGMVKGDGSGVTPAYLATTPNRIQASLMFLRLKGLEAAATSFTGTDNFSDAGKAEWAKPVMAYLKANPSLGMVGVGNNEFDPASPMTAQAYYKVMLEALGYKQGTDFTWENVLDFAKSKGLSKVATVSSFTIDNLSSATVEALKGTVKGGTKTLVDTLVDAKVLTADQGKVVVPAPVATATPAAATATPAPAASTTPAASATPAPVTVTGITAAGAALDKATGISVRPTVSVVFDGAVTAANVSNTNITLKTAAGTAVPTTVAYSATTKTATVTMPTGTSLSVNTDYVLTVGTGTGVAAAVTASFKTSNSPVITQTTPEEGKDVTANTISVVFSQNIDTYTATTSNVKLYNVTEGLYEPITIASNTPNSLTITATNGLNNRNCAFKLTINTNVLSLAGDKLADTFTLNFVDSTTPALVNDGYIAGAAFTSGATDVYGKITTTVVEGVVNNPFRYTANFNTDMDAATVTKDTVILRERLTGTAADYSVSYDGTSRTVTLAPNANLKELTDYEIVYKKEIKNSLGIQMSTVSDTIKSLTTADLTKPTVTVSPATGATNVTTSQAFTITFSESVDPTTLVRASGGAGTDFDGNTATIMLKKSDGTFVNISGWTWSADALSNNSKFTLTASGLTTNTAYTLSIKGYKKDTVNIVDSSPRRNPLQDRLDVTFTTNAGDVTPPTVSAVKKVTYNLGVTSSSPEYGDIMSLGGDVLTSGVKGIKSSDSAKPVVANMATKAVAGGLLVTFSEKINGSDANTTNVALTDLSTGQRLTDTVASAIYGANLGSYGFIRLDLATIKNGGVLTGDKTYRLTISGIRDLANNALASAYTFDFTTQDADNNLVAGPATETAKASSTAGSYVYTADTIADGAYGTGDMVLDLTSNQNTKAKINSSLIVAFDDNITGATTDTVVLTTTADTATSIAGTITTSAKGFTFKPTAALAYATTYKLVMKAGITDEAGNPITEKVIYFKTESAPVVPTVSYEIEDNNLLSQIARDAAIVVSYNGSISDGSASLASNYTLTNVSDGGTVGFDIYADTTAKKVTIYPTGSTLSAQKVYRLDVNSNILVGGKALSTNADANLDLVFKTSDSGSAFQVKTATYNATTKILTITLNRKVNDATAVATTVVGTDVDFTNFTTSNGVMRLIGTPAVSGDLLTVSAVIDTTKAVIIPGTTKIAAKSTLTWGANQTGFGTGSVTVTAAQ